VVAGLHPSSFLLFLNFIKLSVEFNVVYFRNLELALAEFEPDIVVYNAGTDILEGDPLGVLSISEDVGFLLNFNLALTCYTYCVYTI